MDSNEPSKKSSEKSIPDTNLLRINLAPSIPNQGKRPLRMLAPFL